MKMNEFVQKFTFAATEILDVFEDKLKEKDNNSTSIEPISDFDLDKLDFDKMAIIICRGYIYMLFGLMYLESLKYSAAVKANMDAITFARPLYDTIKNKIPDTMQMFERICEIIGLSDMISKIKDGDDSNGE